MPDGMCYVQYMEDPIFNLLLQFGYFWITLTAMCTLYAGIYHDNSTRQTYGYN